MAKPVVTISAPDPLFVGEPVTIDIQIVAGKETKVDFISAKLLGDQGWKIGTGKSQVTHRFLWPELDTRLMDEGVLQAGSTTNLQARFALHPDVPPTHEIGQAWSRLRFSVHISIPWRIDGRYRYDFTVRRRPPPVVRVPRTVRSTAAPGKPRIEIALASQNLIAGEELVGTCAVFHLDDSEPRRVDLALVPELALTGRGRPRERRGAEIAGELEIPAGSAGQGVPFRLALPASMTPSFVATTHSLAWWLVARSGSFFGGKVDVAVPLGIVDRSALGVTPKLSAAPRLGDERIATLFAQFAADSGWKGGEPEAADFAIEKGVADLDVRIAYEYRGQQGTFLVSSVAMPSLGLGLAVAPSSSLRHMFWKDIEVDIRAWDAAHHVKARFAEQAIPFLKAVVPALVQAGALGTMVRWGDTEVVFERPVADVTRDDLRSAAGDLDALAVAILDALLLIPAPPNVVIDRDAWHALATKLGGRLGLGDLSIHGRLDGVPVDLGLGWIEDRPVSVHVAVGDPIGAPEELKKVVIALPRPAADVLAANAAERLVELITRWPSDIVDLRVEKGVASAAYLMRGGDMPVADAERVRTLVESLRAVIAALDPGTGPYR